MKITKNITKIFLILLFSFTSSFGPLIQTVSAADNLIESDLIDLSSEFIEEPLLGATGTILIKVKNTTDIRIYNLEIDLNLPNGVSFDAAIEPKENELVKPTKKTNELVSWENIADLLPNEEFVVSARLKFAGESQFSIDDNVEFNISAKASHSPIFVEDIFEDILVNTKIAGLRIETDVKRSVLVGEDSVDRNIIIKNNTEIDSSSEDDVIVTEILDDGIEFEWNSEDLINNIDDPANFEFNAEEQESGKTFLQWIIDQLKKDNYENPIDISYKIGVPYAKSNGEVVNENDKLNINTDVSAKYEVNDELVSVNLSKQDVITAKYIKINKSADKNIVNPGDFVTYQISGKTSQFYSYNSVLITDTLPNGTEFVSSIVEPASIIENEDGTTSLVWEINSLSPNEEIEFEYTALVKDTYIDNSELLAKDNLNNDVSINGNWNSTEDERVGVSEEIDNKVVQTEKVTTKTTVFNQKTNEWVSSTNTNKGFPVSLKIETKVPTKVPTNDLVLKFFYPEYLKLDLEGLNVQIDGVTSKNDLTINTDGVKFIQLNLGDVDKNTKITLLVNGEVENNSELKSGHLLRTLTRVTYINSIGSQRREVGQATLIIRNPKSIIVINNNDKYTTKDLIKKSVTIETADASLENYVRYTYSDLNTNQSKQSEWISWNEDLGQTQVFPDYLMNGSVDGLKEICVEVKDQLGNISPLSCDQIILDTKAPTGSVLINNGQTSSAESSIVNVLISQDSNNSDNPIYYSYSIDGASWSEFSETGSDSLELNNIDLGINEGLATIFVRFKDEAGNISSTVKDDILIKNPDNTGSGIVDLKYGIEYINDDYITNANIISTYSLNTFPNDLYTYQEVILVFDAKNSGTIPWYPEGNIVNPTNLSYHWFNVDTGSYYVWNGNRAHLLNMVSNNSTYDNARLNVLSPDKPGNYILELDAVHEGVTWFATQGVQTYKINVEIKDLPTDDNSGGVLGYYTNNDDFGWGEYAPVTCTLKSESDLLIAPNGDTQVVLAKDSTVYAFNYNNDYAQVLFKPNTIGWVNIENLNCEKDLSTTLPNLVTNDTYREKAFVCDARRTEMRTNPSWDSNIIEYLSLNQEIYILEELPSTKGNGWLQVLTLDGRSGWVPDSFICVTKDGQVYNWIDYVEFIRPYDDPGTDPNGDYYDIDITSDFGERDGTYHTGIDYGLYCGTELYAAADGVVLYTSTEGVTLGNDSTPETPANYVVIEHQSNPDPETGEVYKFQTRYWHLDEVYVVPGQNVAQGQAIGTSGNTGYVRGNEESVYEPKGCHLHFETHRYNEDGSTYPIDPELLFQYGEIDSPVILGLSELGDFGYGDSNKIEWSKLKPVYRFYSPVDGGHFYTISEEEKNKVINNMSSNWTYEKVAFYAYEPILDEDGNEVEGVTYPAGTLPVYRFWSPTGLGHFYTINDKEKSNVINNMSNNWTYEKVAFYTYPIEEIFTDPVERYIRSNPQKHFFTINKTEQEKLNTELRNIYFYEKSAFFAISAETYSRYLFPIKIQTDKDYLYSNFTSYCGHEKYEVHKSNGSFIGDIYFSDRIGDFVYILQKDYYRAAFYDDLAGSSECDLLGIPTMQYPAEAAKSPQGTKGTYQMYERGGIYHNNKYNSTWAVYGNIFDQYEKWGDENGQKGTRSKWGFPAGGVHVDPNSGRLCQDFEGGLWICGTSSCEVGQVWNNTSKSCEEPPCPVGYSIYGDGCKKDFLGGSIHPISVDSDCIGADIVYSGPFGHDDFGFRNHPDLMDNHDGIDIRAFEKGDLCQVNAVADGEIALVSVDQFGGQYTDVKHANGYRTRYLHGENQLYPNVQGTRVTRGSFIFTMSNTGFKGAHHLHFGLFLNGVAIDPQLQDNFGYLGGDYDANYLPSYPVDLENTIYNITKTY
ncbi:peptidoglycan DD-metalloendopeptidase family protein [Candidatus Dojkabacteria bacterium]|uniref:Peptidoglycan DD-metalloendopeptidase family protein n=1 Tax=Candidatus Dojkabacteria bacterium TaxID=2099670 RepID=A0A955LB03_9BACT|nr:peptidoglycan DD-metalloendopeptidase family protein [Candidatus Dojkabacteria bacterium]